MIGNWFRTTLLMAAVAALVGALGLYLLGPLGLLPALLAAVGLLMLAYRRSDALVLRLYDAREVDAYTEPEVHAMIRDLARRADMPPPRLFLLDQDQPNAFAAGRDPEHAALAVSTGLMRLLGSHELRAVLAHELARIRQRDTLLETLTATFTGGVSLLAERIASLGDEDRGRHLPRPLARMVYALSPLAALPLRLLIARSRIFAADRAAAALCGEPQALARALDKIGRYAGASLLPPAEHHPTTAPLTLVDPLSGGALAKLFATHPAIAERIARLESLARERIEAHSAAPAGVQR